MNYLQIALLSNALFSSLTGFSLILFHKTIAKWFGQQKTTIFWLIGIGLLFFSYSVFIQVRNPNPNAVFYIIIQDMIWVLASIAILWLKPFKITHIGYRIIAGIAAIVLIFSALQFLGYNQIDLMKH